MRNTQGGRAAGPRCALHRQTWFPKPSERGSLLLGHEFLRPEEASGRKTCMCLNKTCIGIGYSASYIPVPRLKAVRDNILKALCQGLHSSSEQWKITRDRLHNPELRLVLAPWHFWPEHRTLNDTTGCYDLIPFTKETVFKDNERMSWTGFPPPNYSPKRFIEDELPPTRVHPRGKWIDKLRCDLPPWVEQYAKVERAEAKRKVAAEQEKI